jgi:hypothetical protein
MQLLLQSTHSTASCKPFALIPDSSCQRAIHNTHALDVATELLRTTLPVQVTALECGAHPGVTPYM